MSAAHEGAPLVLRDSAPGLPKKGPPWDIEGEPEGPKIFSLKRPFEADNKGDAAGHTGHLRSHPCRTKTPSVSSAPHMPNHSPRAFTHHRDAALKSPVIFILRPIERARNWRRTMCQRTATSTWQHVMPPSHARHSLRRTARAGQTAPSPSNKANFSLMHGRCISPQSPNCVRNEGECRMHRVRARAPVFARTRLCLSVSLQYLVDYL